MQVHFRSIYGSTSKIKIIGSRSRLEEQQAGVRQGGVLSLVMLPSVNAACLCVLFADDLH